MIFNNLKVKKFIDKEYLTTSNYYYEYYRI